jgi:UDP-perosamine 4-acetyltransferase
MIGAGGHAKVAIELLRAARRHEIIGLVALDRNSRPVLGLSVIGTDADLPRLRQMGVTHAFVGIGDNEARLRSGRLLDKLGFEIANAISPAAVISESARLGRGIAVMAGAVINADARIDDFAIVNTCASIDHDCWLAEAAQVGPGCTLAGNVRIGRLAVVGAGTTAIPGTSIGDHAVIGAGACVIRDIPARERAWGIPAKIIGKER